MPRIIYAMASDGLLFTPLGILNSVTDTPLLACAISGALAAFLSLLVSLSDLIQMMSIGTLLAYTLVSFSVLILRYQPEGNKVEKDEGQVENYIVASESEHFWGFGEI